MHIKQVPLQLGHEQVHVVKPFRGQHANLVAIELKHAMQCEAPIPEVDPLALGLNQVNPLLGWQDGGQAQETALQKGGHKSAKSLS